MRAERAVWFYHIYCVPFFSLRDGAEFTPNILGYGITASILTMMLGGCNVAECLMNRRVVAIQ